MNKKLKSTLSVLLVAVMMLSIVPFSVYSATGDLTVSASKVTAKAGETVDVDISMKNNPGISSVGLNVGYDSSLLSIEKIAFNPEIGGSTQSSQYTRNPARLIWISATQNYYGDARIATITFKVNENAPAGAESNLTISYDEDDIYNIDEDNVFCVVENGSVKVEGESKPKVIGHSLNLQGKIGVNFFYDLAGVPAENAMVKFSWGNHSSEFHMKDAVMKNGGYEAPCLVASKEIADQITAELYVDNQLSVTDTYSVKDYAEYIINADIDKLKALDPNHDGIALKELCKAMLYYGAKSQVQFNYNTDSLATDDVEALDGYTPVDTSNVVAEQIDKDFSDYGMEYLGSSMSLKSDTGYTLYFKSSDTEKFNKTVVTRSDKTLDFVSLGSDVYYIDVTGIAARDITNDITLSFNGTDKVFNAKSYIAKALNGTDSVLSETVTALYNYNQKAIGYFG